MMGVESFEHRLVNVNYKRQVFHFHTVAEAWKNMTVESDSKESTSPEKLLIDDPSNFQFHAAYLTYSDVFDKASNPEIRKELNQHIVALRENQMDYQAFYGNINRYRGGDADERSHGRAFIETQRKRDWRRKAQKHDRMGRHRK